VASANGRVSAIAKLLDLGANALLKDQQDLTHVDLSANGEVKVAFAVHSKQVDITDKTKNALLLLCAHLGNASRLPAVKAGEDKHKPTRLGKRAW
jgi:urease accessory protein UreE